MSSPSAADFDLLYQSHLKHLKLKGLQPKTIDAYARAVRRAGDYFDHSAGRAPPRAPARADRGVH